MVRYTDRNRTPLAYHTFFRFVALPLGILGTFRNIFEEIGYLQDPLIRSDSLLHTLTVSELLFFLTDLALLLVCFIGFFYWSRYAWYAVMIHFPLAVVYRLYVVVISSQFAFFNLSLAESSLIAAVVVGGLIEFYYFKRKPLFFPAAQETQPLPEVEELPPAEQQAPPPQAAFCRRCGQNLPPDGAFCPRCGLPVKHETPQFK